MEVIIILIVLTAVLVVFFIRGMLDDRLNEDIAGPIALGVLAAKGRMISFDYEDPYLKIQSLTNEYFENMEK